MADLESLIHLRKHTVDEKRKVLAELYRQAEELETRKNQLKDTLQKERQALEENENLEALAYFGRFAQGIREKIGQLEKDLTNLETRIGIAQEDMRSAFAELKRIEIVQKNREKKEKKKQQGRESKELDEIGLEGFRRNDDSK